MMEEFVGGVHGNDRMRCEICEEPSEEYRLYQCEHSACRNCLLAVIRTQVDNNSANMKCPQGCGAEEDHRHFPFFLQELKQTELLERYNRIKIHKADIVPSEKLATCPQCK